MTPSREAIERYFYQRRGDTIVINPDSSQLRSLIDDLLALWPAPSRETLKKILNDYDYSGWDRDIRQEVVDRVMAWAEGLEPKVWCKHLEWKNMDEDEHCRPSGWYATKHEWCFYYGGDFKFCPLCGTPRPAEG